MTGKHTRRSFLALSGLSTAALAADTLREKIGGLAPDIRRTTSYYVSVAGSDLHPGTADQPFRTIQRAADLMQPGDNCLIRTGVYRECIRPKRGGTSEQHRITYKAYPGERAVIAGSERITKWQPQGNNVWMVELSQAFFGDFNPYRMPIYGDLKSKYKLVDDDLFLSAGQNFHLGEVYCDGVSYTETLTKDEMSSTSKTWYTETTEGVSRIWAHFEAGDPNRQLSEINVRESVFFPDEAGLQYITVSGLALRQAASYWATPMSFQKGLLTTHHGKSWIVEGCHVTDAKCVGICSGYNHPGSSTDIGRIGHHIVRNNLIERCGEAGIAGLDGFAASLLENNLIQDINYMKQFGGAETAGIKVHRATDLVISHNIIRRVFSTQGKDAPGIWIDWSNQGVRITGNVVYDIDDYAICLEANHGPLLVDNNILIGSPIETDSERLVMAHNLLCSSGILYENSDTRNPSYYQPHTLEEVKDVTVRRIEDRYYSNIFVGRGFDRIRDSYAVSFASFMPHDPVGFRSGCNLYYRGAPRQPWDETGMERTTFEATWELQGHANGVTLSLYVDNAASMLKCPLVDTSFIGKFSMVNQGIEQNDGSPIVLDRDSFGKKRNTKHPRVGPFEELKAGRNVFTFTAGPGA